MDFVLGILRNAILPTVLIAILGDLVYKVLKNIFFYNNKKHKINDTNNEIIREMMSYIYSNKKYDKFVLTNIISGVHTLREVKLKKLYSLQEFESIIMLEITKSNLISLEVKNDLYEQIKNGSLIKEINDIQKENEYAIPTKEENSKNIIERLFNNEKLILLAILYLVMIAIMSSYFIVSEKKDVNLKEILFGKSEFDIILIIITLAMAIISLIINNFIVKKNNETKDKDIEMAEYLNERLYNINKNKIEELEKVKKMSNKIDKHNKDVINKFNKNK